MTELTVTDKIARLFLVNLPADVILNDKIDDRRFPQDRLVELIRCYCQEYSDTEARLISRYQLGNTKDQNVFQTVAEAVRDLLIVRENQIRCRYENILRWKKLSRELGEDLLACVFLADMYREHETCWKDFAWDIVLGHDNQQLNAIMKEGISENHFHLFGAAPSFPMIWLRMMNDIRHGKYMAGLMGIEQSRRHYQYELSGEKGRVSLSALILQAALMRALMYAALMQQTGELSEDDDGIYRLLCLLECGEGIVHERYEIESLVERLRLRTLSMSGDGEMPVDYALCGSREPVEYSNWLFQGERQLVYGMLCDIFTDGRLPGCIQRLLYPYLVIRTWFRKELVQNNSNIGFENFSVYNRRKGHFLPVDLTGKQKRLFWQEKERKQNLKWMVQHAVLESFQPDNLKSLEIRITPADDFAANVKQIETYDRLLVNQKIPDRQPWKHRRKNEFLSAEQFFYVYHFAKKQDDPPKQEGMPLCRHYRLRGSLDKKTTAIINMRKLRPEIACRVRGIDACAAEIGCRPEVFACCFRRLRMDVPLVMERETGQYVIAEYFKNELAACFQKERMEVPQLAVTYHAGEDFLDPVDGLRALDEAMRFLEMGSGDRFGHATVLGLDLQKWYERKGYWIHLKAQDYLDNMMWFYMMIQEMQMEGCELLKEHLHREFLDTYRQICMGSEPMKEDGFAEQVTIYSYYEAWKLRGDSPTLYQEKRYKEPDWPKTVAGLIPSKIPAGERRQETGEQVLLYYHYHFNQDVKKRGDKVVEKQIPLLYVRGAQQLQKCMRKRIAEKGIGIEVNPSSNLLISTMDSYAEHPVLNLYTMGLDEGKKTVQMYVSINTDDRGVFHTSLESEYALMAASVENLVDENGEKRYSPQEVYEWLDRIRVMGNQQVF